MNSAAQDELFIGAVVAWLNAVAAIVMLQAQNRFANSV